MPTESRGWVEGDREVIGSPIRKKRDLGGNGRKEKAGLCLKALGILPSREPLRRIVQLVGRKKNTSSRVGETERMLKTRRRETASVKAEKDLFENGTLFVQRPEGRRGGNGHGCFVQDRKKKGRPGRTGAYKKTGGGRLSHVFLEVVDRRRRCE